MSEPTTLRDEIEAVIDAPEVQPAPEPVSAPEPVAEAAPEPVAAESAPTEAAQDLNALAEGESGRQRDEQGRFKPKEQEGIQPGPKAGPRQQGEKAPASWRPEAREHWGQLPDPVRAEVQRLEVERNRVLQDSAEARKGYEAIMRTIQPYEGFIRAENSNPIQAIENLMRTGAQLRVGTPAEKAMLVAGICKQYNIDIPMLDSALAGTPIQQNPQQAQIDQVLNQRLAPIEQMYSNLQQAQRAQEQRVAQQTQSEVEQFRERAEFFDDVRDDMADLIEAAGRRGQSLSMLDAYKKACMLNDNVRAVITQRAKNQGAQQQTNAAQKARSAAVSVSGAAPVGQLRATANDDVRASIEAAIVQTAR